MPDTDNYDYTAVNIKAPTRNRLRRYKAEHGITYDQAINQLLDKVEDNE